MKLFQFYLIAIFVSLTLIQAGCISSDVEVIPGFDNNLPVLRSGDMIPLKTKVVIRESGIYLLPGEASRLTTRCFGSVSVTIQRPNENPQVSSCDSATGSSSQTNLVNGMSEVLYNIEADSHAEVTLN